MSRLKALIKYLLVGGAIGLVVGVFGAFKIVNSMYNYDPQWSDVIYEIPTIIFFTLGGVMYGGIIFVIVLIIKSKVISNFFKKKF